MTGSNCVLNIINIYSHSIFSILSALFILCVYNYTIYAMRYTLVPDRQNIPTALYTDITAPHN